MPRLSIPRAPGTRAPRKNRQRPNGQLKSKQERLKEELLTEFGFDFLVGMAMGFTMATMISAPDGFNSTRRPARAPQQGKKEKPN